MTSKTDKKLVPVTLDQIVKALRCHAGNDRMHCNGCIFEDDEPCRELMSERLARACLTVLKGQWEELKRLRAALRKKEEQAPRLADISAAVPFAAPDTVYRIVEMGTGRPNKHTREETIKRFIRAVGVTHNNALDVLTNLGKTVFLTREEAEKALEVLNE